MKTATKRTISFDAMSRRSVIKSQQRRIRMYLPSLTDEELIAYADSIPKTDLEEELLLRLLQAKEDYNAIQSTL